MAAAMFWSMKKSSDSAKPRPIAAKPADIGSSSIFARPISKVSLYRKCSTVGG